MLTWCSSAVNFTSQPVYPAFPALRPVQVKLLHVLLGQRPSLHCLRRRSPAFVRLLHRYYAAVRLPAAVHEGLIAHRVLLPAHSLLAGGYGVSRFSCMERLLCMLWVFDSAGPAVHLRGRALPCCLLTVRHHRHPVTPDFGALYPAYKFPCPTLQVQPYDYPHMARGQSGSLFPSLYD